MGKNQPWSKEKAWEWYNDQPWIRGFNGYPSNCVNRIAMWQSLHHEEVARQVDYEFALAQKTGLNAVRAILQFEVWLYEHDAFMANLEEYITLADKYGIKVMITVGNDCCTPKAFYSYKLGEQTTDWGYHSGIKRGPHAGGYDETGYLLQDDHEEAFYAMVSELADRYKNDNRVQIWNVWNEAGNGRRGNKSLAMMEKTFAILREKEVCQPLTADCWAYDGDWEPSSEIQRRAVELSDVVSFHYYQGFPKLVKLIAKLKTLGRPLICDEWLNRIEYNNVDEVLPLFWLENIGTYHWGLIQGRSQTYEPWGCYYSRLDDPTLDVTKWQHDLYRFNGTPYIPKEIQLFQEFSAYADKQFADKQSKN